MQANESYLSRIAFLMYNCFLSFSIVNQNNANTGSEE